MPRPARILVVEDDPDSRLLLRTLLEGRGEVTELPDAYQALSWAEHESFDLVVTDLLLPGASGVDLLERLARRGRWAPAVVVTGLVGHALVRRARSLGAVVVHKPVGGRALDAAIDAAFAGARLRAG